MTSAVEAAGKSLDKEVHDLYVSRVIAKALLEADPSLGGSVKDVRELLVTQFPPATKDITDDEMFNAMDDVLHLQSNTNGRLPLTLVILDEMQQYLGEDNEKALAVQNIVEGCSARFESQVLFVATGQSALTATPTLQKLTDRFAVQVALSDKDVESVVREVVLRKRSEHVLALKSKLDGVSGEIDRHLGGTQLASKAADKQDLVPDYPLLPTRRRFWEMALRAIDRAGKAGVLRTQLKIVHEAARDVADDQIGHVVGGDFIYEQQAPGMLQSGVLLKEIDELIRGLRSEGLDGPLKSRICALIFLISQVPSRALGGETGLRATAPFLADLLVEDLADDGAKLRKRVPELLDDLVNEGRLMRIDHEYRLQTEEGAEWEKDYRSRLAAIRDDASRMSQLRNERLLQAVDQALGGLKLTHGTSRTPRKIDQHWGQDEPSITEGDVPVWIRDEWSVTESTVKKQAAEAGNESPIVFVFLPKREVDQIKETLASYTAAEDTAQQKPTPQTDEGKTAQRAMKTRIATDEERLCQLSFDRDSWTAPVDATRLAPLDDTDQQAAGQVRALLARLPASGPVPWFVFDAGYDSAQLSLDLADARVAVLVRLRGDRCFYADPPPRPPGATGRPRRHGAKFAFADPATWPAPTATLHISDGQYGTVTVTAWSGLHPTQHRHPGHGTGGPRPIVRGTILRVQVQRIPARTRPPKVGWLWWAGPTTVALDLDLAWRAYIRRFDLEHTVRFCKQTLGWTTPRPRHPEQADRWTWLVLAGYTQLHLAHTVTADARLPWERPRPAGRLTPGRVRRGFPQLLAALGSPAAAPKPSGRSPGRPKGRRSGPAARHPAIKKTNKQAKKAA